MGVKIVKELVNFSAVSKFFGQPGAFLLSANGREQLFERERPIVSLLPVGILVI